MSFGSHGPPPSHKRFDLDRRVPQSKRFSSVTSGIDTGASSSKVDVISTREFLHRRDEIFRRVKPSQLAEMLQSKTGGAENEPPGHAPLAGAGPRIVTYEADTTVAYDQRVNDRPYLVVDVRDDEEFEKGHISQAVSYPAHLLHQDRLSPELLQFRNKPGTVIVVYDADERVAAPTASALAQKGFDNVTLLSGGLKTFALHFSDLTLGSTPVASPPRTGRAPHSRGASTSGGMTARSSRPGTNNTMRAAAPRTSRQTLPSPIAGRHGDGSGHWMPTAR